MVRKAPLVAILLMASGCASTPSSIPASYVSPLTYRGLTCSEITAELGRVQREAKIAAGAQWQQVTSDTANVVAGALIFWPALFLVKGDRNRAELSSLKGQQEALLTKAREENCDLSVKRSSTVAVGDFVPPPPTTAAHRGPTGYFRSISPEAAIDKVASMCIARGFTSVRRAATDLVCQGGELVRDRVEFRPSGPAADPIVAPQVYHRFAAVSDGVGATVMARSTITLPPIGKREPTVIEPRLVAARMLDARLGELWSSMDAAAPK